jgi:hypothetical protein
MSNLSNWYFRIAMVYILVGVTLGNIMGASGDHSMFPLHAHINLLGWVTMSIFAFFYRLNPAAAMTRLAKAQFWVFVAGTFAQMILLFILLRGNPGVEPALGAASIVVGLAFLAFVVNAWKFTASPASATQPVGTAAAG